MSVRDMVIAEAARWEGTPFHWQASLRGVGCDCKGLIAGVARACGLPEGAGFFANIGSYGPVVDQRLLKEGLAQSMAAAADPRPGDVLLLRVGGKPQHLAFLMPGARILHCWNAGPCRVVYAHWTAGRAARELDSAWAFPSIVAEEG